MLAACMLMYFPALGVVVINLVLGGTVPTAVLAVLVVPVLYELIWQLTRLAIWAYKRLMDMAYTTALVSPCKHQLRDMLSQVQFQDLLRDYKVHVRKDRSGKLVVIGDEKLLIVKILVDLISERRPTIDLVLKGENVLGIEWVEALSLDESERAGAKILLDNEVTRKPLPGMDDTFNTGFKKSLEQVILDGVENGGITHEQLRRLNQVQVAPGLNTGYRLNLSTYLRHVEILPSGDRRKQKPKRVQTARDHSRLAVRDDHDLNGSNEESTTQRLQDLL